MRCAFSKDQLLVNCPPVTPRRYARQVLDWLVSLLEGNAAVISALATVATAVIAVFALGSTARDSRERSRPMIFAMFREAEHSDSSFELVVKNFGLSAA